MNASNTPAAAPLLPWPVLVLRSAVGGILMGLANLVPGISGGTMLLAAGIYPHFIDALAQLTTLRFRLRACTVVGIVVAAAGAGIVMLAGTVKGLVVDHRWIMYSLFIGLTLGGVPIVWRMAGRRSRAMWTGAVAGFLAMVGLVLMQQAGAGQGAGGGSGFVMLFVAGAAGASAMILPGVSGGYLLLVLGQYVPILSGIDGLKTALEAGDKAAAADAFVTVVLPVGVGVVTGVIVVSNVLKILLRRFHAATLGVLLGLLVGAVAGLWPFQEGVLPRPGDVVKGQVVTAGDIEAMDPEDYPTRFFRPRAGHVGGALGLIVAGCAVTGLVARLGRDEKSGP